MTAQLTESAAWQAIAVLPNVQMADPIESGWFALVSADDERVRDAIEMLEPYEEF